jgi:hypothetical protein
MARRASTGTHESGLLVLPAHSRLLVLPPEGGSYAYLEGGSYAYLEGESYGKLFDTPALRG